MGLRLRNHLEYRSSYKYGKLSFLNRLIYNLSSVGKLMKDRFDGKIVQQLSLNFCSLGPRKYSVGRQLGHLNLAGIGLNLNAA